MRLPWKNTAAEEDDALRKSAAMYGIKFEGVAKRDLQKAVGNAEREQIEFETRVITAVKKAGFEIPEVALKATRSESEATTDTSSHVSPRVNVASVSEDMPDGEVGDMLWYKDDTDEWELLKAPTETEKKYVLVFDETPQWMEVDCE